MKIRRYDQQMETRRLAVTVPEHDARTMMAIWVIGGAEVGLSRQVMLAMPTRAEGEKGLVRLLSGDLSGRRLAVASFQPLRATRWTAANCSTCPHHSATCCRSPTWGHHILFPVPHNWTPALPATLSPLNIGYPRLRPTVLAITQDDPLRSIPGGQLVNIAIDNGIEPPGGAAFGYSVPGSLPPVQPLLTFTATSRGTGTLLDVCQAMLAVYSR